MLFNSRSDTFQILYFLKSVRLIDYLSRQVFEFYTQIIYNLIWFTMDLLDLFNSALDRVRFCFEYECPCNDRRTIYDVF